MAKLPASAPNGEAFTAAMTFLSLVMIPTCSPAMCSTVLP